MKALLMLAIYAVAVANTAAAQAPVKIEWPIDSGAKVRVMAESLGPTFRRATLVATTQDSIAIQPARSATISLGLDQIRSFEVLTDSHTNKAKYTMVGLLIGSLGGAVLGAATYSPSKCDASVSFCIEVFDRGTSTAVGAFVFGAIGGLVGLMAGASPKETWATVSVPSR